MLSYHADMDNRSNPFELGLDRLVALDSDAEFVGKAALKRIRDNEVTRRQVGLVIGGGPWPAPIPVSGPSVSGAQPWARYLGGVQPRLEEHRPGDGRR